MAEKILIIDDEKRIIQVLTSRLNANGYEVVSATDGNEGIDKAKSEKPNLILLDIMMPGMTGYDIIDRLKQEESTKFIPVIMVTGQEKIEHISKSMSGHGAVDFIFKPFTADELLSKISAALNIYGQ